MRSGIDLMRKAINSNPILQIGLLGVLGLLVGVIFMSRMGGGEAPVESAATDAPATAAPADIAEASPPAASSTGAPAPVPPAAGSTPVEAGKGLPAPVVKAHESGDVVVLLITQEEGLEDAQLRKNSESIRGRGDTTIFTTDVKDVARYSRIAEGVTLDRVPAIIVVHPIEGKGGGEAVAMPDATVSYGYRGPESVTTAVEDALYEGKQLSYDPG